MNWPRLACSHFIVTANGRGLVGFPSSWLTRGKLCAPFHCSTSICQSVISTDLIVMSGLRANAGSQSSPTSMRFAVKNGRSPACNPSIVRFSTRTLPVKRRMLSRPMCIGRSR